MTMTSTSATSPPSSSSSSSRSRPSPQLSAGGGELGHGGRRPGSPLREKKEETLSSPRRLIRAHRVRFPQIPRRKCPSPKSLTDYLARLPGDLRLDRSRIGEREFGNLYMHAMFWNP